ncbi:CpeT/CpcT family [Neolewinella agarilytica]|uniref:CpeT/CpcT family n=2 Tax=Neolewinella agarilytica TaxID=478744 RepID=A0A1H9NDL9_9BACT|nr:CpeT/CpcT family [Neolewinella agarilytica]
MHLRPGALILVSLKLSDMPVRLSLLFSLLFFFSACTRPVTSDGKNGLDELQAAMTGSFDSSAQASSDDSYYNILLHMEPVWTDRPGKYLYVEQAVADAADKPYRQRIYGLEQKGRGFISRVYELPDPDRFIGAHEDPSRLNAISPEDLIERKGCAVYLKPDGPGIYRGSTKKKRCKSTLRGATYATSRVSITGSFVQSWDQGFNDADEQVWGATEGGYMFFKK